MKKLKILYISHTAGLAGAEICLFNLVKYLDRDRFEPVVVFPADGPLKERIAALGITTFITPLAWWVKGEGPLNITDYPQEARIEKLFEIIDQEKPNLIQTNTTVVVDSAVAAAQMKIPHIWHVHEILDGHPTLSPILPYPMFYKTIEELSQGVIVVSNRAKQELSKYLPLDQITTIHNGIAFEPRPKGTEQSLREELSLPDKAVIAITVATLCRYKGQDNLVRAVPNVLKVNPNVHFVHVGPATDEDLQNIIEMANGLGVQENIHYLGFRDDIPSLLTQSDLFVLPSVREAFPLVVLEAMAAAKAVVATDCCGPAEMIEDGVTGFIVPVNDPAALAKGILEAIEDKALLSEMGMQGKKTFEQKFTIEPYVKAFTHYYEEKISLPDPDQEHYWSDAYLSMHEKYVLAQKQIFSTERKLDEANLKLDDANRTLESFYNSYSWKITAPLRWIAERILSKR